MLGVDEGRRAARLLDLGHHVQGQRRLAGALRPIDLDDAALGQAPDPERDIQAQRARGHALDLHDLALVAQLHHRALAKGPVDLAQRRFQSALLVTVFTSHEFQSRLRHSLALYPTIPPTGPFRPAMTHTYMLCSMFARCSLGPSSGDSHWDGPQGLSLVARRECHQVTAK